MRKLRRLRRALPDGAIVAAAGVLAMAINTALVAWFQPVPRIQDEFSYLLAADTYASGRLTNPTHEHWPHFETMHVIHEPSYASKYPPGQGLLLAVGRLTWGSEIAGVCLSTGLAAAACVWMLRAWLPMRWAALGGFFVALHSGVQLQWGLSYWGGALAMAAGACLLGAAGRLAKLRPEATRNAAVFALATVALALTRPFEGFVVVVAASVATLFSWRRHDAAQWRPVAARALPTALAIGLVGIALLGAYNQAVTGSALTMPYQVHEREYGATPLFVWQPAREDLTYRHDTMRRYHREASMWWWAKQQTAEDFLTFKSWLTLKAIEFFVWSPLLLTVLAFGWVARRQYLPWHAVGIAVMVAAWGAVWLFPHYVAPIGSLLLLGLMVCVRNFRTIERRLPPGRRWITPSLVALHAMVFAADIEWRTRYVEHPWAPMRQAVARRLVEHPGDDLVFVRYAHDHIVYNEWVYNRADIDSAPVVWAREIGPEEDQRLIDYFKGRNVWVAHVDAVPMRIVPYTATDSVAASGR